MNSQIALAEATQKWLVVSDVHFDPFADARIVARLNAAPAQRWRAIFATGAMTFSNYGSDTNYPLLESSLEGMRNEAPAPEVVIVAGDFLAHDFRKKFQAATKSQGEPAYEAFVDKTMLFLANEFRTAFPHAKFLPVIGNNDSYCGDYESEPNSPFLAHMAMAWQPSVSPNDANGWIAQFSGGGYYTTSLPVANARAVVVNDVLWSRKYSNACGHAGDDPGSDEITWLRNALQPASPAKPTWLIGHIPPGVDVFSTLNNAGHASTPAMMLADRYNDPYLTIAGNPQSAVVMAIAGHTHMNSFRLLGPNSSDPSVPMLVVPSISPVYSNNPSFVTLDVDASSAAVDDYRVFVLDGLSELSRDGKFPAKWRREYDFDSVFGHGAFDVSHLENVEQAMFIEDRFQARFEQYYDGESGRAPITDQTWRPYWCGNIALTAIAYTACAMPEIQHSLPAQPTAPPTSLPTAAPAR